MSYQAQDQLTQDATFQGRVRACCTQQANVFKDDARPEYVATAQAVLKGDDEVLTAFIRTEAAGPGIADKVDNGDGTIDQSNVLDADLLSLTQASWQVVAGLYFDAEGNPIQ
jgi:hypothetical protein